MRNPERTKKTSTPAQPQKEADVVESEDHQEGDGTESIQRRIEDAVDRAWVVF